ncbi:Z1 domain-containing protein [Myxococcus sp. XM-1-1-1]|uniref:Z1 domain-containing protein n=1 Tax=Myxococcus sp. XM-1-1-1 TaxID=2874602 RepID=UPI001CBCF0B1|nr:Z1 domain-containing protein [Myxococcus sp. XM-1-1-1]
MNLRFNPPAEESMSPEEMLLVIRTALSTMGESAQDLGPQSLEDELREATRKRRLAFPADGMERLTGQLLSDDANATGRNLFARHLHRWDFLDAPWTAGTPPNSRERRQHIYELLAVDARFRALCDTLIPARTDVEEPTVIAEKHEPWYIAERKAKHTFYWEAYKRQLREVNGWPEGNIIDLDRTTDQIVERLSDPERREAYQTKGLVVGYVQSGKTANFTAVVAKAVDAGYRLVIVLAGTLNVLREQTQRRVDKELIGKEIIGLHPDEHGRHDYSDDAEWQSFISHGELPSNLGAFDWQRLTGSKEDYRKLARGIDALEFHKVLNGRRYNDPANLHPSKARLMVVKKNTTVLRRLAHDLGALRGRLDEVPALIIDDESDQASVNTVKPGGDRDRTGTNKAIVGLLAALPRAQYIGYTATPFANVFINPDDAEDLFPKDYIISLDRPVGYMGVADFHDLGGNAPKGFASKERAFVRSVKGDDSEAENLQRAIDSFVLAGAIKFYRSRASRDLRFKHHTMLVHRSHQMQDHEEDAKLVRDTFENAAYHGAGLVRLRSLFEEDFLPVHSAQEPGLPMPARFKDLEPFVAKCLAAIGDKPVSIVNGDLANRDQTPNFDKESVWRILVGGTKLSRGYTVEGLTISYYRRRAKNADTLMQMGRWFGFRRGYRDLVRLFIGRSEPDGKTTIDLYEAFESICLDEELFRNKLQRYSRERNPPLTPKQIPPLVPSYLLMPTARNKMYNAKLQSENLGGEFVESTLAPKAPCLANEKLVRSLLGAQALKKIGLATEKKGKAVGFEARVAVLETGAVLKFLESYAWSQDPKLEPVFEFIRGGMGDPNIKDWLFLAPVVDSPKTEGEVWEAGKNRFPVIHRGRIGEGTLRFKAYSDPGHRAVAAAISGAEDLPCRSPETEKLHSKNRAVILFYPCRDTRTEPEKAVTMGFSLLFPKNNLTQRFYFTVRDAGRPDAVVIEDDSPPPIQNSLRRSRGRSAARKGLGS